MINRLKGIIVEKGADYLWLETHGIEWELECSSFTLQKLPPVGQSGEVFVYLQHREDSMKLFGFIDRQERRLFLDLLKVSGVGPKLAGKILSGIPANQIIELLEAEDVTSLSRIPGLGKKTAQKIILMLKGKLTTDVDTKGSGAPADELVESLAAMGFDKKQAQKILTELAGQADISLLPKAEREKELIRQAIIRLST